MNYFRIQFHDRFCFSPYLDKSSNLTELGDPVYRFESGYNEPDCIARQRTAIIIPYRSREQQLTQETGLSDVINR